MQRFRQRLWATFLALALLLGVAPTITPTAYALGESEGEVIATAGTTSSNGGLGIMPIAAGDPITFTDPNFKAALIDAGVDTNGDGEISEAEAAAVTNLNVSGKNISSLDGIEYFTSLTYLNCSLNQLASLDLSNSPALEILVCGENQLTSLDVSSNPLLQSINCFYNQLTLLDVSNNPALEGLTCDGNQLTSLDISNNIALLSLSCRNTKLTSLDVTNNFALRFISYDNSQLTSLDISNNPALISLSCDNSQLTSLDISNNPALTYLSCEGNQLATLDVSNNPALTSLKCRDNLLTSLDVSHNSALTSLDCSFNNMTSEADIIGLNKSITTYFNFDPQNSGSGASDDPINFTDPNFKSALIANGVDTNGDGEISEAEAEKVNGLSMPSRSITSLDGIEYFTGLRSLYVENNQLTELDVSQNIWLENLTCGGLSGGNLLTELDVSNNPALKNLYCEKNLLTELDLSKNTMLTGLHCNNNQLTELDLSKNPELVWLRCQYNNMTSQAAVIGFDRSSANSYKFFPQNIPTIDGYTISFKDDGGTRMIANQIYYMSSPITVNGVTFQASMPDDYNEGIVNRPSGESPFLTLPINVTGTSSAGGAFEIILAYNQGAQRTVIETFYAPNGRTFTHGVGGGAKIPLPNNPTTIDDLEVIVNFTPAPVYIYNPFNAYAWSNNQSFAFSFDSSVMGLSFTGSSATGYYAVEGIQISPRVTVREEWEYDGNYSITLSSTKANYNETITISTDEIDILRSNNAPWFDTAYIDFSGFTMPAQDVDDLTLVATFARNGGGDISDRDKIDNVLDDAKNGNASSGDILDAVRDIDLEEAMKDHNNRDKLEELEDIYKGQTGIAVTVDVDNNTHGDFKNHPVTVVGAAFNAQPGSTVSLKFTKPDKDADIDGSKYDKNSAVQVDIDLIGVVDSSNLDVPIAITVAIPSGISPQNFRVLHYRSDGTYEIIVPTINGDGTCTFIVTSFSVFAFVNENAGGGAPTTPTNPKSPGSNNGSSSGSKSSRSSTTISTTPVLTWMTASDVKNPSRYTGQFGIRANAWAKLGNNPYQHDMMDGNSVQVRVKIYNPSLFKKDTMLSAYVKGSQVDQIKILFGKWFKNKVQVIHFDQQTDWEQTVGIAAKIDLNGMNSDNLIIYSYDKKANSYRRIQNTAYRIDKNGYLHFVTELAGDIIISDGPLEKK